MTDVSAFRLNLLRATYLLMALGLGATIWPGIVSHPLDVALPKTVVRSLLGAVGLLAVLGLRQPLRMLPLMLFELAWKSIWLVAFAVPLWRAGRLGSDVLGTVHDCLLGVAIFPIVIPWRYVIARYVTGAGERSS